MTPSNQEVDRLIREALSREESDLYDRLGPPAVHEMLFELYRGRNRWLAVLNLAFSLAFFVGAIWCAIRLFEAQETREMLLWMSGFFFCTMAVAFNKLWTWLEMQRNMLSREIKRLELQVAHLANELRPPAD